MGRTSSDRNAYGMMDIAVVHGRDEVIYSDGAGPNWRLEVVDDASANARDTSYVHSGTYSCAINLGTLKTIKYVFNGPEGLDCFGYTTLDFYINPGTASVRRGGSMSRSR